MVDRDIFEALLNSLGDLGKVGDINQNLGIAERLRQIQQQVVEIRRSYQDLEQRNSKIAREIVELREAQSTQGRFEFHDGAYWRRHELGEHQKEGGLNSKDKSSGIKDEGPFCSKCWEADRKLVRGQVLLVSGGYVNLACDSHSPRFEFRVSEHLISDIPLDPYREAKPASGWRPRYL